VRSEGSQIIRHLFAVVKIKQKEGCTASAASREWEAPNGKSSSIGSTLLLEEWAKDRDRNEPCGERSYGAKVTCW
jgi:hypothetical protein